MQIGLEKLLKEAFPPDGLTKEIVLTRPEEVYKFQEGLSEELQDFYGEVVGSKINEQESQVK